MPAHDPDPARPAPAAAVACEAGAGPSATDDRSQRILPWLVAVGFFMQTLDGTILNTALPAMARDLHESPLRMQSVVLAYMVTVALLIPASGWLADRWGTRRVFVSAIGLFTLGSLLCALSPSLSFLVAARVLQGVGGALLLPVGRLAILRVFSHDEMIRVLSFVSIPGLLGPLIGPTLGGWLVQWATWHWVFLINLPVGLIGIVMTRRYMINARRPSGPFDARGFALFSLGVVLLSLALQGLGERAITTAASIVMVVAGLASMLAYWLHAARARRPLFSTALLRIPTYAIGLAGNLFSRLGSGAMPFLVPLYLQVALGYSPGAAGMSMIPSALGAISAKPFAPWLIKTLGYRRLLTGNTLLLGCSIGSFALSGPQHAPGWLLLQLGIFGLVNSTQFTAMNTLTLGALDERHASSGNSLMSVVVQLSMSLGVAAGAGIVLAFSGPVSAAPSADGHALAPALVAVLLHAFHATFLAVGGMSMLASLIFVQLRTQEAQVLEDVQ